MKMTNLYLNHLKKSNNNKKTAHIIWIVFGVLFLSVVGYTTTTINNNQATVSNTLINDSGVYYSGTKAFSRTADVVVCRGTSALDDLYKSFTCDYVCPSTSPSCDILINIAITNACNNNYGIIKLGVGEYGLDKPLYRTCNYINFVGAGINKTILKINSISLANFGYTFMIRTNETYNSTNWEISKITFDSNQSSGSGNSGGAITPSNGDYIHDILIKNSDYFGIYANLLNNVILQNIYFTGYMKADRIGGADWNNVNINGIYFINNITGSANIDILRFNNSILQNVEISSTANLNKNTIGIYFEPAIESSIENINIGSAGGITIQSDSSYGGTIYNQPRDVLINNVKAKQITIIGQTWDKKSTSFGNIVIKNAILKNGNYGVLITSRLNESTQIINNFILDNIYSEINSTGGLINTGKGNVFPSGVIIEDGSNTSGYITQNYNLNNIYTINLNETAIAYSVYIGDNLRGVANVTMININGLNLTNLTYIKNGLDIKTDISPKLIGTATFGFHAQYINGNVNLLNLTGTGNSIVSVNANGQLYRNDTTFTGFGITSCVIHNIVNGLITAATCT